MTNSSHPARIPSETLTIDVGDVDMAVYAWRSAKPRGRPIVLLHATGFHSHCWQQVVNALPQHTLYAVDLRYHGKSGDAGTVNWGTMANDIERVLETLALENVMGVGHSIGGHLLARVAARNPALLSQLMLIDPVIMSPQQYQMFEDNAALLAASEHPVARRKNAWQDAQEMFDRFVQRSPFDTWDPAVLRDYCDHALRDPDERGIRQLACLPANEAAIYLSQQGNKQLLDQLHLLQLPVTLLRAPQDESDPLSLSTSPTWPDLADALPDCQEIYMPDCNHFIPMQKPQRVAQLISELSLS